MQANIEGLQSQNTQLQQTNINLSNANTQLRDEKEAWVTKVGQLGRMQARYSLPLKEHNRNVTLCSNLPHRRTHCRRSFTWHMHS